MAINLNFLVIVAFVRLEQKILSQFKRIFWRSASLYMSHVVTLKKDGSEAIIPKVKMATSRLLFTFLLSPWQAVLNEQVSHSLSPLHTVLLRVLLLLLLPMLRSQWLEGIRGGGGEQSFVLCSLW